MTQWNTRLSSLSTELAEIEVATDADDIEVRTYRDHTTVTLQYEHGEEAGTREDDDSGVCPLCVGTGGNNWTCPHCEGTGVES